MKAHMVWACTVAALLCGSCARPRDTIAPVEPQGLAGVDIFLERADQAAADTIQDMMTRAEAGTVPTDLTLDRFRRKIFEGMLNNRPMLTVHYMLRDAPPDMPVEFLIHIYKDTGRVEAVWEP